MTTDWEKIGVGLDKYQWIMQTFKNVDVSTNSEFKKRFNHFYRIRQRTHERQTTEKSSFGCGAQRALGNLQ